MADAKKSDVLAAFVHVTKKDGEVVILEPGQKVPSWAAKQVTNPNAFADAEPDELETKPPAGAGGGQGGENPPTYADQDEDALRGLLKERELPQDGDKAALVARLEQADQEAAAAANQ